MLTMTRSRELRRAAHQAAVTGVQVAHRRHERDALADAMPCWHELAQLARSGDDEHGAGRGQKQCSGAGYSRVFTACV